MSRSVSAPSSVTNTSPCWKGLIVPGSTLMYGSNFWTWTLRPRAFSRRPSDAAVMPLPRDETTPPVTKTYFGGRAATSVPPGASRSLLRCEEQARQGRRERSCLKGTGATEDAASRRSSRTRSRRMAPGAARSPSLPPERIELAKHGGPLDQLAERAGLSEEGEACEGADRGPAASSREFAHGTQA